MGVTGFTTAGATGLATAGATILATALVLQEQMDWQLRQEEQSSVYKIFTQYMDFH